MVPVNSKTLICELEAVGWVLVRTRGSHHAFQHPRQPGTLVVPHPKKDLPVGTARNIARVAGWLKER